LMGGLAAGERWRVDTGCCLAWLRSLPSGYAHACVTSPPYFGLRAYLPDGHPDKGKEMGGEGTPVEYVGQMVAVFREVRRVLRPDGTLWLNLGDSYTAGGGSRNGLSKSGLKRNVTDEESRLRCCLENKVYRQGAVAGVTTGAKPKDLLGIPWRVAFALQDDGWYLRSDIIWAKSAAMPESVEDRPTKAHEYVFLLAQQPRYFFDMEAVRTPTSAATLERDKSTRVTKGKDGQYAVQHDHETPSNPGGAQPRSVIAAGELGLRLRPDLTPAEVETLMAMVDPGDRDAAGSVLRLGPEPCHMSHFAVMPSKLAEFCILAGTSARGCCGVCGAPWRRVVEKASREYGMGPAVTSGHKSVAANGNASVALRTPTGHTLTKTESRTLDWQPGCACPEHEPESCRVIDPFCGSGTTLVTAIRHGRRGHGVELNPEYAAMARRRVGNETPALGLAW
jgi:DNA modification methylase